jgi:DNA-binding Lrp family transcriptional regulator
MTRSSVKQIEQDEIRILEELLKNANKSVKDIAQKCDFSRQKVWRVIKNLEKNLTIWGYTAIVDEEKLNKKSYIMLIKRTNKPLTKELLNQITSKEILNNFKKVGIEIKNSYYINGAYDWVVCFNTTDIIKAKSFSENYNKLFEGFVSESHLMEIMFKSVCCGTMNPEIKKLKDFFQI